MICVSYAPGQIRLEGHAGAGPYGQDPVCAAVSSLILAFSSRQRELGEPAGALRPGCAVLSYRPEAPEQRAGAELVLSGLRLLAGLYPECISIEKEKP